MVYISKFILASTSPRRRDLLHLIGADFQIEAPAEEEPQTTCTDPEEYVSLLSYNKAMSIVKRGAELPVVAADTIVTIDGNILGSHWEKTTHQELFKCCREDGTGFIRE